MVLAEAMISSWLEVLLLTSGSPIRWWRAKLDLKLSMFLQAKLLISLMLLKNTNRKVTRLSSSEAKSMVLDLAETGPPKVPTFWESDLSLLKALNESTEAIWSEWEFCPWPLSTEKPRILLASTALKKWQSTLISNLWSLVKMWRSLCPLARLSLFEVLWRQMWRLTTTATEGFFLWCCAFS